MRNSAQTYKTFVLLEERAASLYLDLAVRFLDNTDLSWFWVEMSIEEKRHVGLLQFCLREQIATRTPPDQHIVRRLRSLFRILEKRAAAPHLTVDDAFLIAADLEGSEINPAYANLISPISGPWYIMREKIETSVPGHMDGLIQGARRFGVSLSTMARLVDIAGGTRIKRAKLVNNGKLKVRAR